MEYKVSSIDPLVTAMVRERMVSPQYPGLAAAVSVANGYGPCRSCLRVFDQGNENRIFFTYNAFEGLSDLPDPGPVFIHEKRCTRYEGNTLPADLLGLPILFEAFGEASELLSRTPLQKDIADRQISEILALPEVRFINVRNAEAGCFICRIEPGDP
ncbi:MAG TPA: DUF1203 domain-containing protein [Pyrinomonadaceae bacterium]|nr:DUF1203 domain-containing protein [Pyrinomonadaceae bacterium]